MRDLWREHLGNFAGLVRAYLVCVLDLPRGMRLRGSRVRQLRECERSALIIDPPVYSKDIRLPYWPSS